VHRPRSVREADVSGKNVLVRADLNVPLEDGRVADDTRIRASLPTLRYLLDNGATSVAVCSHLGRPKGPDPAFAMAPAAERVRELLPDERVRVLENTRFDAGETRNDPETARRLADGMDLFVNDAFGSAHRAHASTEGVARWLPAYAGLLLEKELEMLGRLLGEVERPFVLVAGGAKVEDKLGVLVNLGQRADTVLVGGKMAEELRDESPLPYEAELVLENEQDPLLGGLIMRAKPPHKKVLRLEALSGGEKSLVSMAFLFSIQQYDPSPFYLLDEVDQNLDAVNAEKVARMIRRNSHAAQFVQISLRKVTLKQADHIAGVTMRSDGISELVMKVNLADIHEEKPTEEVPA